MKFVEAKAADGKDVRFWLKQGWTGPQKFSAIQFGLFSEPGAAAFPNRHFIKFVEARVASAKSKGASHALLIHMSEGEIVNYVALEVDDVAEAYRRQMALWPKRARNTKTPTLWFEDARNVADTDAVTAVTDLELPLSSIGGVTQEPKGTVDVKKLTAEQEVRMRQQAFRLRVGTRCGWRCVVTGTSVKEVLDAAHLPGKDWRTDNQAEDGVLLRTDIHRLLDRRLAELRDGKFWLDKALRQGEYGELHQRELTG
ncbi:HNH endonuclease signature motif containing protein [Roseateles agri]|nr:HNH endonuclease signature motif containing protein [Paucibacter sp. R3-3]